MPQNRVELISLIITTYNSADYLQLALSSLAAQDTANFEVIVADDGSSDHTAELIASWQQRAKFKLLHAWQHDLGFRAAKARNNAVRLASGNYLIFVDGDCLLPATYISRQRAFAEHNYFVRGSRVMLAQKFSQQLLAQQAQLPNGNCAWLAARLTGKVKQINTLLKLPFNPYSKTGQWYGVKTCNLALWQADFMAVNGFDESYVGWGHEDADLAVRLLRYGVKRKEGRSQVPVLHLWHAYNSRAELSANEQRLRDCQAGSYYRCQQGIAQNS